MARKREFDEDKVLDALRDVFWQHGYEGTSYAQIMAATGLQKGSLYAAFGDKKSLYHKAISRYDSAAVSGAIAMLRDDSLSGEGRIGLLMDALINDAETPQGRWGCFLCNAATDMSPFDPEIEDKIMGIKNRVKDAIKTALKNTSRPDMAELVWATYFGGRVLIKAGARKATLRALKKQTLTAIDG